MISINDWEHMLLNFDYYYSYSDDYRVWKRGEEQQAEINRIYDTASLYHKELYSKAMMLHRHEISREAYDLESKRIRQLYALDDLLLSINGGQEYVY